jgi:hypothetical protein
LPWFSIKLSASARKQTKWDILTLYLYLADSKGHFRFRAPVKYLRERFLDTEWKKDYAWRPFLDPLIIGFGDQQLITGYAVLLSGWIKVLFPLRSSPFSITDTVTQVGENFVEVQGAHFVLILYICALSSSTHLAALITLRKYIRKYKLIAKIRITLVILFAVFLFSSMIAAICMPPTIVENSDGTTPERSRTQRLSFIVPLFLILVGFSTALVCILYEPKGKRLPWHSLDSSNGSIRGLVHCVTDQKPRDLPPLIIRCPAHILNPLITFIVQILLAILSAVLVLTQKFAVPENPERFCGLQDEGENRWGFGQTLSVVMLLLPAMSACQTYLEGRQDIREGR